MAIYAGKIACSRGAKSGQQQTLGGFGFTGQNSSISVTAEGGGLKVRTPFNRDFVEQLKIEIPSTGRKWDNSTKCWYVVRDYADKLKIIIDAAYGGDVQMPTVIAAPAEILEYTFQADYVANSKNGVSSVHCNGGWNAKIAETVLRSWFKQADSNAPATFYGLLGVDDRSKPDAIKKAYYRAARQWHPDVCREAEAAEMFQKVKAAYDVLSEPMARVKYDAGLHFEKLAKMGPAQHRWRRNGTNYLGASSSITFIPMLRCGKLTVKAKSELGSLVVTEILAWEDVTNEFSQTMISFWAGDNYSVMWV